MNNRLHGNKKREHAESKKQYIKTPPYSLVSNYEFRNFEKVKDPVREINIWKYQYR